MDELTQIQKWLKRSNYDHGKVTEPTADGIDWLLEAHFPSEDEPTIIGRINEDDSVVARRNLGVDKDHQKVIAELSDEIFRKFYFDLRRDLLLNDILFGIQGKMEEQEIVQIHIARSMWIEDLSRGVLMDNLQAIYNSMMLARLRIQMVVENERPAD